MQSNRNLRQQHFTLGEMVTQKLLEDIVEARFQPGHRLKETALADEYGVSRSLIREAIRRLEGHGLVEVISGKGTFVRELSADDIRDIYDIRIELDGLAVRLATLRITDHEIRAMERLLNEMTQSLDNPTKWMKLNNQFHLALYRGSDRKHLCRLVGELMNVTSPYAQLFVRARKRLESANREHRELLEAVKARDPEKAEEILEGHLRQAVIALAELVETEVG